MTNDFSDPDVRADFANIMATIQRVHEVLQAYRDQFPGGMPKTTDIGRYFVQNGDAFAELRAIHNLGADDHAMWNSLIPHVIGMQLVIV